MFFHRVKLLILFVEKNSSNSFYWIYFTKNDSKKINKFEKHFTGIYTYLRRIKFLKLNIL